MTTPSRGTGGRGAAGGPEAARECALRLLARPRTEHQIRMALTRRGYDASVQEEVVTRLRELGLLDDLAYARAYIQEALVYRPMGKRALADRLARRGVSREHIRQALAELAGSAETVGMTGPTGGADAAAEPGGQAEEPGSGQVDPERLAARRAAQAWLRRNRQRVDPARLQAHLLRRGFEWELASQVTREVLGEEAEDAISGGC